MEKYHIIWITPKDEELFKSPFISEVKETVDARVNLAYDAVSGLSAITGGMSRGQCSLVMVDSLLEYQAGQPIDETSDDWKQVGSRLVGEIKKSYPALPVIELALFSKDSRNIEDARIVPPREREIPNEFVNFLDILPFELVDIVRKYLN